MEEDHKSERKKKIGVLILAVLLVLVLLLIFLLSPLKELVFPSAAEPALTLSVVESIGPDAATGLYRVVVEAKAEGRPEPLVTFNRNDGAGEVEANRALLLLEGGETFLLKALAANLHGVAESELELFAGVMVGAVSGRAGVDQAGRNGTALPGEGGGDEEEPPGGREDDEDDPADPGEADTGRVAPVPPGSPGEGDRDVPAHQINSVFYRHDRMVDGERVSDWMDITSLVNRGAEAVTLHDYGFFHVFEITTFDIDDEDLWDYINIELADGHITYRGITRERNAIHFVWQIEELRAEHRGDFYSSATVTLRYPPGTEDRRIIRVFSPATMLPGVEPEGRRYSSFSITPEASNSGYVASDGQIMTGVVLLGDSDDNRQYKGYLSFPAIWHGPAEPNLRLESVDLVFNNINISGNPQEMASLVDFKWFDYGDTLDPGDFAVGGTRLFTIDSTVFNTADGSPFVISGSDLLKEGFAYAIGTGSNVQIKMGLNRATNHDNSADIFQIHTVSVQLVVNFSYRRE